MKGEGGGPPAVPDGRPCVSCDPQSAANPGAGALPGDDARLRRALTGIAPTPGGGLPDEEDPMSRTSPRAPTSAAPAPPRPLPRDPDEIAAEVATVLGRMSYEERVRAYRSGAVSTHELAVAAARFPDRMPLLNDEFEWIAIDLE
jgi:hypothetical protein